MATAAGVVMAAPVAGGTDVTLGGAPLGKLALSAGLGDEILVHIAPYLPGAGVPLFADFAYGRRLEKISVSDGQLATYVRYRVAGRGSR